MGLQVVLRPSEAYAVASHFDSEGNGLVDRKRFYRWFLVEGNSLRQVIKITYISLNSRIETGNPLEALKWHDFCGTCTEKWVIFHFIIRENRAD